MFHAQWTPPPTSPAIDRRHVHLWRVPLDVDAARAIALLTDDEAARRERYVTSDPRRRFTIARATLRRVLSLYLNVPPHAVRVVEEPGGKPHLERGELQFNVYNSGDLALIAVTAGRRVGVDLERERLVAGATSIARRWFTSAEREALERAPQRFLELWTRKEAQLKAVGGSVWDIGAAFEGTWNVVQIAPAEGFVAAIAVEGESDWELEAFDVSPEHFPAGIRG